MAFLYYCFATLFLFHGFHYLEYVHNITFSVPLLVNQTLVSPRQVFELGFFRPNGSENLYIGISYKDRLPFRPAWVANREKPLASTDQSASLTIGSDGNLKLIDGQHNMVWSTNVIAGSNISVAELQDNGNFVLTGGSSGNITWQSFDYPSDILLPGMKVGVNFRTGEKRYMVSWKSDNDPSPGSFTGGISSETPPQAFTWNSSSRYFRGGYWDKTKFIGVPGMNEKYNSGYSIEMDSQQETSYFSFDPGNVPVCGFFIVSPEGFLKLIEWEDGSKQLSSQQVAPKHDCEVYGSCGPLGVCNAFNSPICSCLSGFEPRWTEEWNRGSWKSGCTRKAKLNCENNRSTSSSTTAKNDVFEKMSNTKLPDFANYIPDISSLGDYGN